MDERMVTVILFDTQTGEVRTVLDSIPCDEDGVNYWFWSDGNFSCDCNRAIKFFGRFDDFPCGDGRFKIIILDKGGVVYSEFETDGVHARIGDACIIL